MDKKGDLYSKDGTKIKPEINKEGTPYKSFKIWHNNNTNKVKFHRLQAYQKFGDKIFNKGVEVRHLDNDSLNNSWDNIDIGSSSVNKQDNVDENLKFKTFYEFKSS